MEDAGAKSVYVVDSGGRLTVTGVRYRVRAYRDVLDAQTQVGIHAHENLSLSVANSGDCDRGGRHPVDASLGSQARARGTAPSRESPRRGNGSRHATSPRRRRDADHRHQGNRSPCRLAVRRLVHQKARATTPPSATIV
jgi:hypothetical protein